MKSSDMSPATSNTPATASPGSSVPGSTNPGPGPVTTATTIPPRKPVERTSVRDPTGISQPRSISSDSRTPVSCVRSKARTRPMFTPRIVTASPLRIPPASSTWVRTV